MLSPRCTASAPAHLVAPLGLVAAVATVAPEASAAARATTDTSLTVPARGMSAKALVLSGAGSVVVKVTSSAGGEALEATLVGPKGAQPMRSGLGTVSFTYELTAADFAAGALWSVRVQAPRAKGDVPVTVHVEYPGSAFSRAQLKERADAQATNKAAHGATTVVTPSAPPAKVAMATLSSNAANAALANKSKALAANIGVAPLRNIPIPAGSPPAPDASNGSSGYPPSQPTPTHHFAQINDVVITSLAPGATSPTIHTCNGYTSCTFRRGDALTIHGTGFNAIPTKTVSFFYFANNRELDLPAFSWSDTEVMVQVPDQTGLPAGAGAMSLGAAADATTSTPWGFTYQPVLTTDMVAFVGANFPGVELFHQKTAEDFTVISSMVGGVGANKTTFEVDYDVWGDSISGTDTILGGAQLKNGWTVSNVTVRKSSSGGEGDAWLADWHQGTSDPSVKVSYWADAWAYVDYYVEITVQGEPGTSWH